MAQLSGTVFSGGTKLAGVKVQVAGKTTKTSSTGYYRVQKLSTGLKTVSFTKTAYQPLTAQVTIRATNNVLNVTMMPVSTPVTVTFGQIAWS